MDGKIPMGRIPWSMSMDWLKGCWFGWGCPWFLDGKHPWNVRPKFRCSWIFPSYRYLDILDGDLPKDPEMSRMWNFSNNPRNIMFLLIGSTFRMSCPCLKPQIQKDPETSQALSLSQGSKGDQRKSATSMENPWILRIKWPWWPWIWSRSHPSQQPRIISSWL